MKDWNPAAPARSPCSRKHMYRPVWSFPMIQRRTGWKCCGQMRLKSSSLASSQLAVFGGGGMLPMTPRTPSPPSNVEVETLCFGGVFLLRGQDNCTASKGRWNYSPSILYALCGVHCLLIFRGCTIPWYLSTAMQVIVRMPVTIAVVWTKGTVLHTNTPTKESMFRELISWVFCFGKL